MNKQKTILFVGAHPDDETFGVGGTLAQYRLVGTKVYYVCATRGEVGSFNPQKIIGYSSSGDMRWAELECAAQILGLSDVIYLGYRDSGMPGSDDNKHPNALVAAPIEQVASRVTQAILDIKPEVVITFDPIGGYWHPDHIAIHNATAKAFQIARHTEEHQEAGSVFQPQKLYFSIFSRRLLRVAVKLMPLLGMNPHQFGRNKDVDLTKLIEVNFPIHAIIRLSKQANDIRNKAAACYRSQVDSGPPRRGILNLVNRIFGQRDLYMRAYPLGNDYHESDLFEGITS